MRLQRYEEILKWKNLFPTIAQKVDKMIAGRVGKKGSRK